MTQWCEFIVRYKTDGVAHDQPRLINMENVNEIRTAKEGPDWCTLQFDNGYSLVNTSYEDICTMLSLPPG